MRSSANAWYVQLRKEATETAITASSVVVLNALFTTKKSNSAPNAASKTELCGMGGKVSVYPLIEMVTSPVIKPPHVDEMNITIDVITAKAVPIIVMEAVSEKN